MLDTNGLLVIILYLAMLEGAIESLDGYYATIKTEKGEILYWPIWDLPQGISVGHSIYAQITTSPHIDPKQLLNKLLLRQF